MRPLRIVAAGLGALVGIALATYVAGERTEVAVLRTVDAQGVTHDTKLWVVDADGAAWVRVARPERHWFQRLQTHPESEIVREGVARRVVAKPDPSPETRAAIDRAFRTRYGLVDWWYGLLLRRNPVPVRLDPAGPA